MMVDEHCIDRIAPAGCGTASRKPALFMALVLLTASLVPGPAWAENAMGYQIVSQQAASGLPRNHGSLGMDIERAQQISDGGMTFDLIRVKGVRQGSPGARAGFGPGDQIIAVDGRVFASLVAFAGYVGSISPGTVVNVDYIPANGGPAQAQRVPVTVGAAGSNAPPSAQAAAPGLSTGTKVAIGVGAAALFGCYELGCFSHKRTTPASNVGTLPNQQPGTYQSQGGLSRQ